jgi:hypothetical protein
MRTKIILFMLVGKGEQFMKEQQKMHQVKSKSSNLVRRISTLGLKHRISSLSEGKEEVVTSLGICCYHTQYASQNGFQNIYSGCKESNIVILN